MNPIFATDQWTAFMDAIRANPLDDLPRLVSADWLDETGDKEAADFATFIRLGCEIAEISRESPLRCLKSGVTIYQMGDWNKYCRCRPCSLRRREWACLRGHKTWDWTLEVGKPMAMWEENMRKRSTFPWQLLAANYTGPAEPRQEEIPFPHFFAEFDRGFIYRCRPTMAVWIQYGAMAVRGPFACLERVEISDSNPFVASDDFVYWPCCDLGSNLFSIAENRPLFTTHDLPAELYSAIEGESKSLSYMEFKSFTSEKDAVTALSTAALKWAWSQTPPE